jgi:hypothetical protein
MNGQRKFRGRVVVGGLARIVLLVFPVVVFQMFSSPAMAADRACYETSTFVPTTRIKWVVDLRT